MIYGALGLVEVLGTANAILAVDHMLKAADVRFQTWHTKCGGHTLIFMSGDVSAVSAAVVSVKGNAPCEIFNTAVISSPSRETKRLVEEFTAKQKKN